MPFKRVITVLVVATCIGGASNLPAQAVSTAASTQIEPYKSLDALVTGLEKQLVPLAEAMPADKYSFAPSNDLFKVGNDANYKGVRTFGQQLAHIIQANDFFFSRREGRCKARR